MGSFGMSGGKGRVSQQDSLLVAPHGGNAHTLEVLGDAGAAAADPKIGTAGMEDLRQA